MSTFAQSVEIDRALRVLSLLCTAPTRGMTLSAIAPHGGWPELEAQSALDALIASGWAEQAGQVDRFAITGKTIDMCRCMDEGLASERADLRDIQHRYARKGAL